MSTNQIQAKAFEARMTGNMSHEAFVATADLMAAIEKINQNKIETVIELLCEAINLAEGGEIATPETMTEFQNDIASKLADGQDALSIYNWLLDGSPLAEVPWEWDELDECYPEVSEVLRRI